MDHQVQPSLVCSSSSRPHLKVKRSLGIPQRTWSSSFRTASETTCPNLGSSSKVKSNLHSRTTFSESSKQLQKTIPSHGTKVNKSTCISFLFLIVGPSIMTVCTCINESFISSALGLFVPLRLHQSLAAANFPLDSPRLWSPRWDTTLHPEPDGSLDPTAASWQTPVISFSS